MTLIMSGKIHNKLVRDNIPEIIRKDGMVPHTRVLGEVEFKEALLHKLIEEARELAETATIEERVDVAEVLRAIDEAFGFTAEAIEKARADKAENRGGFRSRIFLERAE